MNEPHTLPLPWRYLSGEGTQDASPQGQRHLELGQRTLVMGILNITPDSFSDGGQWLDPDAAVTHGLEMLHQGADLLDLGAESTRPGGGVYGDGARTLGVQEELDRLLPVLERLRSATDAPLSVDTRKGAVARAALLAGADLINDVSLLSDDELGRVVAETGCPLVLMHSRGPLATMQRQIDFTDVVEEVRAELADAVGRAKALGVSQEQVIVDPGIGFGKTYEQNLLLIRELEQLRTLGCPILLGTSRKSFIGQAIAGAGATPRPPSQRLEGSLATAGWAAHFGVEILRVHDVAETARFLKVWQAIDAGTLAADNRDPVGTRPPVEQQVEPGVQPA